MTGITVISEKLRRWCVAQGVPAGKLHLIRNAPGYEADPARVAAALAARRARPPGRPLRALFLGRLDGQKGLDRLAAVVARTQDRVEWRVVGRAVLDRPVDLGLTLEPPATTPAELDALYAWADAVLLPSRFEGVPLIVLEAQRFGCAVVATDVGATSEVIEDGVDGFLVPQRPAGAGDGGRDGRAAAASGRRTGVAGGRRRARRRAGRARRARPTACASSSTTSIASCRDRCDDPLRESRRVCATSPAAVGRCCWRIPEVDRARPIWRCRAWGFGLRRPTATADARLHRPGEDPALATLPLPAPPAGLLAVVAPDAPAAAPLLAALDGPPLIEARDAASALPALARIAVATLAAERAAVGELHEAVATLRQEAEDTRVAMLAALQGDGHRIPPPPPVLALEALPSSAGHAAVLEDGRESLGQVLGASLEGIAALALHLGGGGAG